MKKYLKIALLVIVASVVLAYLCLRFYDIPLRKWLTSKFLGKK